MDIKKVIVGPITTNCYIVSKGNDCFIVDPGDEPERVLREIGTKNLKFILLTHGHFDHVLALEKLHINFWEVDE
jgi:glyoxylase-like metal-dependent hydrolase (beta-lactamase superfamily II)